MDRLPLLPSYVLAAELAAPRPIVALSVHGAAPLDALAGLGVPVLVIGEEAGPGASVPVLLGRPETTPLAAGSAGAVLCTDLLTVAPERQAALLREARRLCGEEGAFVVMVSASDEPTLLSPDDAVGVDAADLQRLLRAHFPHIALLAQLPLLGYSLRRYAYSDEETPLTMHETFMTEEDESTALVAVCGARYRRLDVSHLVRLPFRPFDEHVRARLDELQDLYQSSRSDAARARDASLQATAELERVRPDADRTILAERAAAERAQRLAVLEPELERLRVDLETARGARASLEAELRVVQGRAAEAEAQSATAAAAVERLSQLRDEVVGDRARLTREVQELRERVAELRRTLDEREEQLALLRTERDAAGAARAELARKQEEVARALQLARAAAQDADARERGTAATVDALRGRLDAVGRDLERSKAELAAAAERAGRLEEDLRRSEAAVLEGREEARAEVGRRDAEIRRLGQRLAELETESQGAVASAGAEAGELRAALRLEVQGREDVAAQLARVQEERDVLRVQLREAQRVATDLGARLDAAEEAGRARTAEAERLREGAAGRDKIALDERAARQRAEQAVAEARGQVASAKSQLDELRGKMSRLEAELETGSATRAETDREKEALRGEVARLRTEADGRAGALADELRERETTRTEAERLRAEVERLGAALAERVRESEELHEERSFLEHEVQRLSAGTGRELEEAREEATRAMTRASQAEAVLGEARQEIAALQKSLAAQEDERIKARAAAQRAAERTAELEASSEEALADAASAKADLAAQQASFDEATHEIERLRRDAEQIRPVLERLVKADAEAKREVERLRVSESEARAEVERQRRQLAEAVEEADRARKEATAARLQVGELQAQQTRARLELEDTLVSTQKTAHAASAERDKVTSEMQALRAEQEKEAAQRETLDSQVTHLHTEIEIARIDARRSSERIAELTREVDRLRKELALQDPEGPTRKTTKPGL